MTSAESFSFQTTHWSVVLAATQDESPRMREALEVLCRTYWFPLYAYIRRKGYSPEDAQDLTQEFFARVLRLNSLTSVKQEKGRFRSFLLASLHHFLADAWDRAQADKRGGKQAHYSLNDEQAEKHYSPEAAAAFSPERYFDRQWAFALMGKALTRLGEEQAQRGRSAQHERLKVFLSQEPGAGEYDELARDLQMTAGALAVAVHRLRQRYAELIREEVANTVTTPAEVQAELNYLLEVASA